MREGGKILAAVLGYLQKQLVAGITPKELSALAEKELLRLGGSPVYVEDFPDIMCISVNDQVQHAIPSTDPLELGDIVNFDFWMSYKGMITDAGVTVGVDEISADAARLIEATRSALYKAIAVLKDGVRVGDISAVIEARLRQDRLGIVKDLSGHGVGHELHEEPGIPNFGRVGKGPILKSGMTIAIEPIANLGSGRIYVEPDNWTLVSADGSWSSQHEHTVLITDSGSEILTKL